MMTSHENWELWSCFMKWNEEEGSIKLWPFRIHNGGCFSVKLWIYFIFLVFMWRHHIRKLKIIFSSEVSVPSDKRPYRTLTFHNVLARQGSSFCNRARLNFQAFALRDTKVAAQQGCRVGQRVSYCFSFGQLNSACSRRSIYFNV